MISVIRVRGPLPELTDSELYYQITGIEDWPDYKFTTSDDREFALLLFGDSIGLRLRAKGFDLGQTGAGRLEKKVYGAILEIGSDDPPMIFGTDEALVQAWAALHESFSVPLTPDECFALGLDSETDEDAQ